MITSITFLLFLSVHSRANGSSVLKNSIFTAICKIDSDTGGPISVYTGTCAVVNYGYGPGCVTLSGTITEGTPPYNYSWTTNGSSVTSIGQTSSPSGNSGSGYYPGNTTTVSTTVCPTVTTTYTLTVTDANNQATSSVVTVYVQDVRCGNNNSKVLVCHYPPGNPANMQTICVSPSAVPAHLAHGDVIGNCAWLSPCSGARLTENSSVVDIAPLVITLSPNPAADETNIIFTSDVAEDVHVFVTTIDGRLVSEFNYGNVSSGVEYTIPVPLQNFESGIYLLTISNRDAAVVQKLVKN